MLAEGEGLILSKVDQGFGFAMFGNDDRGKIIDKIAASMTYILKHKDDNARRLMIDLLTIVSLIAIEHSDTYRALKVVIAEVQMKRNEKLNDLGLDIDFDKL